MMFFGSSGKFVGMDKGFFSLAKYARYAKKKTEM